MADTKEGIMITKFFCETCNTIREGTWWMDVEAEDVIELMHCPVCGRDRRISRSEIVRPATPTVQKDWEIKDGSSGQGKSDGSGNKELDKEQGS